MTKILIYSPGGEGAIVVFEGGKSRFIEKETIALHLENYGGSFAKAMWLALYKADSQNTNLILSVWDFMIKDNLEQFYNLNN